jgi:hypothetical protein
MFQVFTAATLMNQLLKPSGMFCHTYGRTSQERRVFNADVGNGDNYGYSCPEVASYTHCTMGHFVRSHQ